MEKIDVLNVYKGYFNHLKMYKDEYVIQCFDINMCGGGINPSTDIAKQLIRKNKESVINEIKKGNRDIKQLLNILSKVTVNRKNERVMDFTFIGIRITTDCNLYGKDRCKYCDQKHYKGKINIDKLKEVIVSISNEGRRRGINASLSGGEPLLLFDDLFGAGRLLSCLYQNGYIVNMNSNLHLVAPQSVLPIINSGLANIHTSFDSSIEVVHDKLVCKGAMSRVIEGIKYIQFIKRIFNISFPTIHINVVATKENLLYYDKLLEFLLQFRMPQKEVGLGSPYNNPGRMDLSPHLIPLGGKMNEGLMPSMDEWKEFETRILPKCREIWNAYLITNGIQLTKQNTFDVTHYYSNPLKFNAVSGINENKEFKHCYIAPTQLYIVNNGDCYICGCHADSKEAPIMGNIYRNSVDEIICRNINFIANELPHPTYCVKCAKNTRKMNVVIEKRLVANIQNWIFDWETHENNL